MVQRVHPVSGSPPGFAESPVDPMTMMITLPDVEKAEGISGQL